MLKDFLNEKVQNLYDEGYEFYDLPYELFGESNVKNWPDVVLDDEPDEVEPLDMENFEIISVNEDAIKIACGGDWQEPKTLTIELVDGELTVTNVEEGFDDGMDEEEFLESIGVENPNEDDEDPDAEDDDEDY